MMKMIKTRATVVKLDRGFPLLELESTSIKVRGEYCAELSKSKKGVTIGDRVEVIVDTSERGSDLVSDCQCIIAEILPRERVLARKDAVDRGLSQAMAANFDEIVICHSAYHFNLQRLVRELVIANNTGATVELFITKSDLIDNAEKSRITEQVSLFNISPIFINIESFQLIDKSFDQGNLYVLLGASGVGKSTLINYLCGEDIQKVGEVRTGDLKGKHTTVAREIFETLTGARVIDMPGVRALGILNAEEGMKRTFPSIYKNANFCKFRNCTHTNEPGCAVIKNVKSELLEIWRSLNK